MNLRYESMQIARCVKFSRIPRDFHALPAEAERGCVENQSRRLGTSKPEFRSWGDEAPILSLMKKKSVYR